MSLISVSAERDLYASLLDLGGHDDPESFLEAVCELAKASSTAEMVFIGVFRDSELLWSCASGVSVEAREDVLRLLSTGVLSKARESGSIVQVPSALLDPEFRTRTSVQRNQIEAVLCAATALGDGLQMVLYLQRYSGGGPFPPEVERIVERMLRYLPAIRPHRLGVVDDPTEAPRARLRACAMVGRSAALARVLEQLAAVAPLSVDVLLTGPSGTGKSMAARLVHDNSERHARPFKAVNCAAIPEGLFEAELFGAEAGAYTGASKTREGLVGATRGGTLFLDEIGELSLASQAKLLQLLQERQYRPVGSDRLRRADVRIVAATNVELETAVAEGRFRQDLRYRLEIMPIRMPGLKHRRSDVRPLVEAFCRATAERHPQLSAHSIAPRAMTALVHADWPGNVRQLMHTVEAGLIRAHARGASVAEVADLLPAADEGAPQTWQEATRQFQRQLLASALEQAGGNVTRAAEQLDLARSHAFDLVRTFGLR